MRLLFMAIIFIALNAISATAADEPLEFRSFLNATSCEQVVKGLEDQASQNEIIVMVGSFISGSNFAKGRDSQIDIKGMLLLTEQYCRQNPQQPVTAALVFLDNAIDRRIQLEKQQKQGD